jgi:hypothetical protein
VLAAADPLASTRDATNMILSRPRRPRRAQEWDSGKAVTFLVTLAANGSVTLAADRAGMSRKSAYALKSRDPAFARAWQSALAARRPQREGDKVEEVDGAPNPSRQGDTAARTRDREPLSRSALRDRYFASLAALRRTSAAPAQDLLPSSEPLSLRD